MINISRLPQKVEIKFWDVLISLLKASGQVQDWIQKNPINRREFLLLVNTIPWIILGAGGLVVGFILGYLAVIFL